MLRGRGRSQQTLLFELEQGKRSNWSRGSGETGAGGAKQLQWGSGVTAVGGAKRLQQEERSDHCRGSEATTDERILEKEEG
jgi:hypothetical protein